jgi:5-formyltetrahydrofolate cyclo-ligase
MTPAEQKQIARERTWTALNDAGAARFPRPIHGRIPNFAGSEVAARALIETPEFRQARVVKVNPDAPQRFLRVAVLRAGKILLAPTPRLREGFMVLDPSTIDPKAYTKAAAIGGLSHYGRPTPLEDAPRPDLLVVGSVAVSLAGARTGKGEGYGEIEYALLRELGRIDADTPIATTVHDLQVVETLPLEPFDVTVDLIVTPTRVIRVEERRQRPDRIFWDLLPAEKRDAIPLLQQRAPRVRHGWGEAAQEMARRRDNSLLDPVTPTIFDGSEW